MINLGGQKATVLATTFRMLRALTLHYHSVQRRMFDNLDRILNCRGAGTGWENGVT